MATHEIKIAVASEDHSGFDAPVGQHFGRCVAYTLVHVARGEVGGCQVVENPFVDGHEPGDVPGFIAQARASVLLTGGIGRRAISFFDEHGIQVSSGHAGTVREAVDAWLSGTAARAEPCAGGDHDHHGDDACRRAT